MIQISMIRLLLNRLAWWILQQPLTTWFTVDATNPVAMASPFW